MVIYEKERKKYKVVLVLSPQSQLRYFCMFMKSGMAIKAIQPGGVATGNYKTENLSSLLWVSQL